MVEAMRSSIARVTLMNHLLSIWYSPRITIREILDSRPRELFVPLAATYGVVHNLHLVMRHEVDLTAGAGVVRVVLVNIVVGAGLGVGGAFAFSYLLSFVGRLFGGTPSSQAARTVLAWASVPYLPLLVVILPLLLIAGDVLMTYPQNEVFGGIAGTGPQIVSLLYFLLRSVMAIWSMVIAIAGLSEAFRISPGRSFLVFVLAAGVVIALIVGSFVLLDMIGVL
ncbi:YIP1 family protein [bacterium]|nr:YIP1 family protein [bacterium]